MNTRLYKTFCAKDNNVSYELIKLVLPKFSYEYRIICDSLHRYSIESKIKELCWVNRGEPIIVIYEKFFIPDNKEYIIVNSPTIDFLLQKRDNIKAFI